MCSQGLQKVQGDAQGFRRTNQEAEAPTPTNWEESKFNFLVKL